MSALPRYLAVIFISSVLIQQAAAFSVAAVSPSVLQDMSASARARTSATATTGLTGAAIPASCRYVACPIRSIPRGRIDQRTKVSLILPRAGAAPRRRSARLATVGGLAMSRAPQGAAEASGTPRPSLLRRMIDSAEAAVNEGMEVMLRLASSLALRPWTARPHVAREASRCVGGATQDV